MSYIYKITNNINNKSYIGKTNLTIKERFQQHCNDRLRDECSSRPLYSAMNKYGIKNFQIEEIEECEPNKASEREIYWINYYDTYRSGYNATLGGDGKNLFDYKAIASRLKEHPVSSDVAKEFNCSLDTIRTVARNYNIELKNKSKEKFIQRRKKVCQYDKDGMKFIQSFESVQLAAEWISNNTEATSPIRGIRSHIADVANHKRKTAYGYKWEYID